MTISDIRRWTLSKLTILRWIKNYDKKTLQGDATAGLTVGVMLIPQAMAYAVLAGVPPIYGLYASVIPLLIYPLFATSRHISIGVVAIDMLIISAGVSMLEPPDSGGYAMLVIVLAIMVGAIQLAMSVARLGFIVNLLSKPVILGFSAAAPIIIATSQLGNLLGVDLSHSQHIYVLLADFWQHAAGIQPITAFLGLGCIIALIVLRKFLPALPEALIVVIISSLFIWGAGLRTTNLDLVGIVPRGLPNITLPGFSLDQLRRLLPTAITLALVQFMHVISVGRTFSMKHGYTLNSNRELFAIGSANFIGGFFQSMPVSGSFSRTAVNEKSGAQTPLSNIFAAVLIILALLLLTPLLYYIPMPALAAIIIVAALGLIDIEEVKYLFKTKEQDGYIALFTFFTMLLIGIQEGILLGVAASLVGVLIRNSRPHIAELGKMKGAPIYRDIRRFPEAKLVDGILVIRIDASFSFNNAEYLKEYIIEKSEESERKLSHVIIDGMSINDLDTTAVEALQMTVKNLKEIDVELYFAGLKGPVRDIMMRSGLARKIGGRHFHLTPHEAVIYILKHEQKNNPEDHRLEEYQQRAE